MAVRVKPVEIKEEDEHRVFEFMVHGRTALFTDAFSKTGGEKTSYQIPTYSALKGICDSIYWKPSISIRILAVRVLNPIEMHSRGMITKGFGGGRGLSYYSYLKDVAYQVRAMIEPNYAREDLKDDYTKGGIEKHFAIMKRSVKKGGRKDIFLGVKECFGYVEPCKFGEGNGYYDNSGIVDYGVMPLAFNYPDKTGLSHLEMTLWDAVMENGILYFPHPKECSLKRVLSEADYNFTTTKPIESVETLYNELFSNE